MQPLWTFTVVSTCPYTLLTTSKTKEDGLLGTLYDLLLQPSTMFQKIFDSEVRIIDSWVVQEQMTHSFTPSTQGWMLSHTKGTQSPPHQYSPTTGVWSWYWCSRSSCWHPHSHTTGPQGSCHIPHATENSMRPKVRQKALFHCENDAGGNISATVFQPQRILVV